MELTIPELTAVHIGLLALALVVGLALGWVFRGERSAKEKIAVNAGWQDQLDSRQAEQDRLAEQNKGLMEQISQYQNSHKESAGRAQELSESLKESFERRDELQRQLGEFRSKLESTVAQRDQLKAALEKQQALQQSTASGLKEKDDKIFHLSRELTSWQSRVPPLVEKFQQRDKLARELEDELEQARNTLAAYEEKLKSSQARTGEHTRIEPVDAGSLDGLDASNEPHADTTAAYTLSNLEDQIDNTRDDVAQLDETPQPPDVGVDDKAGANDELIAADMFVDDDDRRGDEAKVAAVTRRLIEEDAAAGETGTDDAVQADADADADSHAGAGPTTEDLADDVPDEIPADAAGAVSGEEAGDGFAGDVPDTVAGNDTGTDNENRDDLKQIKGVGPAIEKTLNELGIFSFNQIAEMSEYEIDRVAQRVKGFRSRIYRQNWIAQARDLHHQKINNRPS